MVQLSVYPPAHVKKKELLSPQFILLPRCSTVICFVFVLSLITVIQTGQAFSAEVRTRDTRSIEETHIAENEVPILDAIADPIEPFNRTMGYVNHGLMKGVVGTIGRAYGFLLPEPARKAIRRFGNNLEYPKRLINNILQGKLAGAGIETKRFVVNTTLGGLGLFDAAEKMGIGESEEDFGQTLGTWGWKSNMYLVLPVAGPGSERDLAGLAGDTLANPATYFFPLLPLLGFNRATLFYDDYTYLTTTEYDPYEFIRYGWSLTRKEKIIDYSREPAYDDAVQTLETVFLTTQKPHFHKQGKTRAVTIPATGKKLPYTAWMQPGRAPVVYILPGLGSHRLSHSTTAVAEMLFRYGFSAVSISNAMNFEFMDRAASTAVPGYAAADVEDIQTALAEIRSDMRRRYGGNISSEALLGISLGGLHVLLCAARKPHEFDRYIAVYTPVQLLNGMRQLDGYYKAPLEWAPSKRVQRIENTLMKAIDLGNGSLTPETELPFTSIEARYLIGLRFRITLRDIIYQTLSRWPDNPLHLEAHTLLRQNAYRDILNISYEDYFKGFVYPYYAAQSGGRCSPEDLTRRTDLRFYEEPLRKNERIRIFINANDFLLAPEDIDWLRRNFAQNRLQIFTNGGHMGNLHQQHIQARIMQSLEDLRGTE